ncbi:hypothetical protein BGW42_006422 [Actinomortierella wolfii]|nr:hypothetical protein BGW42_006422 [Actinomortierella wolfii]
MAISKAEPMTESASHEHPLPKVSPSVAAVAGAGSQSKESGSNSVGLGINVAKAFKAERRSHSPESKDERRDRGEWLHRHYHYPDQQDQAPGKSSHTHASTACDSLHYRHHGNPNQHYGKDYERYMPYGPLPVHHSQPIVPSKHSLSMPPHEEYGHGQERDGLLLREWQAASSNRDMDNDSSSSNRSRFPNNHALPHHSPHRPPLQHSTPTQQPQHLSHHSRHGGTRAHERHLSQNFYLQDNYQRDRLDQEHMGWGQRQRYDPEQSREMQVEQEPGHRGERPEYQSHAGHHAKEFVQGGAAESHSLDNSIAKQESDAPRPIHSPIPHPQVRQALRQLTPPRHHHVQLAPVSEDTIPSDGHSAVVRLLPDQSVKEEGGSRCAVGRQDHHPQHILGTGSPHAHSLPSTPQQQPSPSLSASTPPAAPSNTSGYETDPTTKMILPLSPGAVRPPYTPSSRKPRPYPCTYPGCGRVFEKRCNMLSHHWTHFPAEMPRHPCPTCGKSFTRMHDVQRHISTVHEGSRNFVCAGCKRAFARRNGLNRHQQQSELCRGTGVLTPAEAAAIGGLSPAAARGPRGRKPPLHMSASLSTIPTTMSLAHTDNRNNQGYDFVRAESAHSSSMSPLDSAALVSDSLPFKTESNDIHEGSSCGGPTPTEPRQWQQRENGDERGDEMEEEEDLVREGTFDDEEIDQLQDDHDDDPEEEVDQLADEEDNQPSISMS